MNLCVINALYIIRCSQGDAESHISLGTGRQIKEIDCKTMTQPSRLKSITVAIESNQWLFLLMGLCIVKTWFH